MSKLDYRRPRPDRRASQVRSSGGVWSVLNQPFAWWAYLIVIGFVVLILWYLLELADGIGIPDEW
jgi:hypothetical protein